MSTRNSFLSKQYRLIGIVLVLIILFFSSNILVIEISFRYLFQNPKHVITVLKITSIVLSVLLFFVFNKLNSYFGYKKINVLPPPHHTLNRNTLLLQGLGISVLLAFIVSVGEQIFSGAQYDKQLLLLIFSSPLAYWFNSLFPAISEEIVFRGGLIHSFKVIGKKRTGIIISGIIFGLLHLSNLRNTTIGIQEMIWIFNLALAGIVLGYVYIRYGLIISIFTHWFWNTSWGNSTTMQQVEQSITSTIIFIAFIIFFEILAYKDKQKNIVH